MISSFNKTTQGVTLLERVWPGLTNVMTWPGQSPDLNPIENLCDELGRRIDGYTQRNKEDLWENGKTQWYKITSDVTKKLVESMPRRLQAVIAAKGSHTSYRTVN